MRRPPEKLVAQLRAHAGEIMRPEGTQSIEEIAVLLGVARTTLYYYFAGRDDLVDFLLADKVGRIGVQLTSELESEEESIVQLTRVLSGMAHVIAEDPALCTTLMSRLARAPKTHDLVTAVDREVMSPLRKLLLDGRSAGVFATDDIDLTAHSLYGAISTAAMAQFGRDGRVDADLLSEVVVYQLVAGIRVPAVRSGGGSAPGLPLWKR